MTDPAVVERLDTAVSTMPTDAPEADGTLSRNSTTSPVATGPSGELTPSRP
ncbi:hypothetical protein [Streptomyces indiaensis]|uniref:Uncharacterized protein n=1 Tax=Streptomyces indiaensis TaxID=284033 RepID=A0ABN3DIE1_9ACTN|nr:hypothetical protein [Streptomyces indiaensis]MCF1647930.1 hypothetical protein [Streptomyces indiaensis]